MSSALSYSVVCCANMACQSMALTAAVTAFASAEMLTICRSPLAHIDRTAAQEIQPGKPDRHSIYRSKALQEELQRLDAQQQIVRHHR